MKKKVIDNIVQAYKLYITVWPRSNPKSESEICKFSGKRETEFFYRPSHTESETCFSFCSLISSKKRGFLEEQNGYDRIASSNLIVANKIACAGSETEMDDN